MWISLQIIVYDGNTGEKVSQLGGEKAHNGGIYAVSQYSIRVFFFCKFERII